MSIYILTYSYHARMFHVCSINRVHNTNDMIRLQKLQTKKDIFSYTPLSFFSAKSDVKNS